MSSFDIAQAALPLAYSAVSAVVLLYLSKKPVNLDQYESLRIHEEAESSRHTEPAPVSESTNVDNLQAQYQAQRSSGMSINLARLGFTFLQLGLLLFSLFLLHSDDTEDRQGQRPLSVDAAQIAAWTYALMLTFIHVIRPALAYQFWIRPQLDLFYVLQLNLSLFHLYTTNVLALPLDAWPLWLKLDIVISAINALLLVTSLLTRPYQPSAPPKKLKAGEIARLDSIEYSSSIYSRVTFSWVNPLVYLGYKRPLQDPDLPNLEGSDFAWFSMFHYKQAKGQTFSSRLIKALSWEFFIQFLWAMPWCILINVSPYCLNKIVKYMECKDCGPPTKVEYGWVFCLLFAAILESMAHQSALHKGRRIFVHTTSICNAEVFGKTLRRKDMASSVGKDDDDNDEDSKKDRSLNISNLVAVDIKKLENPFSYLHYLYGFPIQFVIAGFQLYNLLGYASLVGIAFMIVSYPIPAKLYAVIMKLFKGIMNTKDERMDALNEMLSAIRIVKFFGWEGKFEEKITAAREKELKRTKESYKQIIMADIVWMIMPLANIVVILFAYTKLFGNEITASKVFTTLALFNIMRQALNSLPWQIKSTMQAIVSMRRINQFLQEEDVVKDTVITKLDGKTRVTSSSTPTIGFVNASFIWPNKENEQAPIKTIKKKSLVQRMKAKFSKTPEPVAETVAEPEVVQERFKLKNINADFPVGQLSVIVGPTGSGKSALLLALLGELERVEGSMYLPRLDYNADAYYQGGSGIAYVSQTAWLQNSTIRDNILFGKDFDQDLYDAVVEGCALATDFEILEAGDKTEIGEQGITLSGGQKQRVALARAVYSDANVLLLDDCLSAVDTHTGKHLFQTLTGPLLKGRTIIMATHQVQLTLNSAALVMVLNKGEILGSGTPSEVVKNQLVENVTLTAPASDAGSEVSTLNDEDKDKDKDKDKKKDKKEKVSVKLTEDEKKAEGAVEWRVYKTYLIASGGVLFWSILVFLFIIRETIDIGQNAWLAVWTNSMKRTTGSFVIKSFSSIVSPPVALSAYKAFTGRDDAESNPYFAAIYGEGSDEVNYYLGVYVLLSVVSMLFAACTNYYVVFGGLAASRKLHEQLLRKIIRAKVRFFDTTPIGRIINRFSSDMSTIDDEVSNTIQNLFACMTTITGIVVIISYSMPLFMIPAVFIVAIYAVIAAFYIPISRDLKRLNSNSKSPILNHFNETLKGISTIRAYGFEKRFLSRNLVNLDDNNRTFFLLWSANRWLHWRVDVAGASVSFITGILVLQNWGKIAAGWAALSLSYSLMFTGTIVWVIRIYAMNEMNLNSVERVVEYMDLEEEPPAIIEGSRPPASWPHAGEIVVDGLTMRYAPDTPDVIKGISFTIKAGEKIGVVGRTGSGKSTLAISLFRFMDPVKGTITIDGIDICKIGLQDLRSNLTIIPQDPILFKGTLRSNLDPFGEREDRELWEALRRSHLIPDSRGTPTGGSTAPSKRNSVDLSQESSLAVPGSSSKAKSPTGSIKDKNDKDGEPEIVDSSKITLDTPVKENGSNFSQGQRQLIALARALVRQSKIIVMDEATASVDFETDLRIQTTIREEMADATIITIAHRIRTIADFDRVLVMSTGEVAEFDKPYTLMTTEDSLFRSMCERSSEFDALLAIAKEKERKDREAAAAQH